MFFPIRFYSSLCLVLILNSCNTNEIQSEEIIPEIKEEQKTSFIFEDDFSEEEKNKLENWISSTSEKAQELLGQFPFDLYYHFHREDSINQAVIFGHTARTDSINAAHFYVNPVFEAEEFSKDWMAPHEISHLALPKLPKSYMWFYEGFATYLSREVMIETGIYKREEVDSLNYARVAAVKDKFISNSFLPVVADSLISEHQYPAVYWIGASYFMEAEKQLQIKQTELNFCEVVNRFQLCCHTEKMKIEDVLNAWNEISYSTIFTDLFETYTNTPCYSLIENYK
ncbi:MAG: hypothetical protein IPM77_00865 [Crocinitomicaceae bacterium]|nr:hypothetical protein [Crocinitomicaceae bacterium]